MKAALLAALTLAAAADAANGATISPSGAVAPVNLLRIEVLLDAPLEPPLDMGSVSLLDGDGRPIEGALLDLSLPDRDGRHVAILMHPGRLKNGVGANLALGPAIREGNSVTLSIADPRLPAPITRRWTVGAPQGVIRPAAWAIAAPRPGSRLPLTVTLHAPLNASAATLLAVADSTGQRLPGRAELVDGETAWRFVPARPWRRGSYRLRVHPSIEDPAGNRLCAPFEQKRQSVTDCSGEAVLDFAVK